MTHDCNLNSVLTTLLIPGETSGHTDDGVAAISGTGVQLRVQCPGQGHLDMNRRRGLKTTSPVGQAVRLMDGWMMEG